MVLSKAVPPRTTPSRRPVGRPADAVSLRMELRAAGQEMRAAGIAIQYADRVGRRDLVLHTAGQLVVRGEGYLQQGDDFDDGA